MSNYLQQICTSPSEKDILLAFREKRLKITFGANSPWRLFRRHKQKLCATWIVLVLTSLPIHFLLNGIFGYTRTIPWTGAIVYSNETTEWVTGNQLTWTNISVDMCLLQLQRQKFYHRNRRQRKRNTIPRFTAFLTSTFMESQPVGW
jgi:hypothetical protein